MTDGEVTSEPIEFTPSVGEWTDNDETDITPTVPQP